MPTHRSALRTALGARTRALALSVLVLGLTAGAVTGVSTVVDRAHTAPTGAGTALSAGSPDRAGDQAGNRSLDRAAQSTAADAALVAAEQATAAQAAAKAAADSQAAAQAAADARAAADAAAAKAKADAAAAIPAGCERYRDNQLTACKLLPSFGFGTDQMPALVNLWNSESNWDQHAENSGSGAYGIPQALPGDKMASAGADWQTNPATQIKWGLQYIKDSYGSPGNAWNVWQSQHWY